MQHALIAFDSMGADINLEYAREILGWVRREGLTGFTKRDAHAALKHRFRRADELDPPLEVLSERHYIRELPQSTGPKGGRPSLVFEVNPGALSSQCGSLCA